MAQPRTDGIRQRAAGYGRARDRASFAGAAFQDMDGDGHAELLFQLGSGGEDGLVYAPLSALGGAASMAPSVALAGELGAGLPPNGPNVRWIDLDGDGFIDALQATLQKFGEPEFNCGNGGTTAHWSTPTLIRAWAELRGSDAAARRHERRRAGRSRPVAERYGTRVPRTWALAPSPPARISSGRLDVAGDDLRPLSRRRGWGRARRKCFYAAPTRVSIWRTCGWATGSTSAGFGHQTAVAGATGLHDPPRNTVRIKPTFWGTECAASSTQA